MHTIPSHCRATDTVPGYNPQGNMCGKGQDEGARQMLYCTRGEQRPIKIKIELTSRRDKPSPETASRKRRTPRASRSCCDHCCIAAPRTASRGVIGISSINNSIGSGAAEVEKYYHGMTKATNSKSQVPSSAEGSSIRRIAQRPANDMLYLLLPRTIPANFGHHEDTQLDPESRRQSSHTIHTFPIPTSDRLSRVTVESLRSHIFPPTTSSRVHQKSSNYDETLDRQKSKSIAGEITGLAGFFTQKHAADGP